MPLLIRVERITLASLHAATPAERLAAVGGIAGHHVNPAFGVVQLNPVAASQDAGPEHGVIALDGHPPERFCGLSEHEWECRH